MVGGRKEAHNVKDDQYKVIFIMYRNWLSKVRSYIQLDGVSLLGIYCFSSSFEIEYQYMQKLVNSSWKIIIQLFTASVYQ